MGKLIKILIGAGLVIAIILVGLSFFVHFYLTEERVKALVISPTEKALNRTVEIGGIAVGLFSGITVTDLAVKEPDGKTDFIGMKKFILRYDLWPLFRKKIVVSDARLVEPFLRVFRHKDGKFNFKTLAFLMEAEADKPASQVKDGPVAAVLPLALTVNHVTVEKARIIIRDAMKEIPYTDVEADLNVALEMGRDWASLKYRGDLCFVVDAVYGNLKPHVSGKSDFDQDRLGYTVHINLEKEKIRLWGEVKNYAKGPGIRLDLSSDKLDFDRLLSLAAVLPSSSNNGKKTQSKSIKKKASSAPGAVLPPGLKAAGEINVAKTLYKGLEVNDFLLQYTLNKGVLTVRDFSAGALGGRAIGKMWVDLNKKDLSYKGQFDLDSIKVEGLLESLAGAGSDMISGVLNSHITFSGAGTQWPKLRDALSAEGTFSLNNGRIRNTPVTSAVADLLGIDELRKLSFESLDGSLHLRNGMVLLKSRMSGDDVEVRMNGTVGLDGKLDMPVSLRLSPELSAKFNDRVSVARYITNKKGEAEVHVKLTGMVTRPRPTLDTARVKEQLKETVRKKAGEMLEEILFGEKETEGKETKPDAVEELIKGLIQEFKR